MADVAEATTTPAELGVENPPAEPESITFGGTPRNLVPGIAMVFAAVLAFFMDMTNVFFAEAAAWVFLIWGVLLIYAGLLDIYETYEVTDGALVIRNVMRPWNSHKEWAWDHVVRLEVLVRKKDWKLSDAKMEVYYTIEGDLVIDREDRAYDPRLAGLIIEHAGLKPAGADNPEPLNALKLREEAEYSWQ